MNKPIYTLDISDVAPEGLDDAFNIKSIDKGMATVHPASMETLVVLSLGAYDQRTREVKIALVFNEKGALMMKNALEKMLEQIPQLEPPPKFTSEPPADMLPS